jgi:AcrR family transcriptional regulator
MPSETLTPEHILEATEDVLRRYGPAKATVVDVARVLGVSHGSVYRHFPSKAALHAAVAARWLDRTEEALEAVAGAEGPADVRLRRWLAVLFDTKRRKAHDDPEMFATYMALIGESGPAIRAGSGSESGSATVAGVVARHVAELRGQLALILEDGVRQGVLAVPPAVAAGDAEGAAVAQAARRSVEAVAGAVFDATRRFHDPAFAPGWREPGVEAEFALLVDVVVRGLRP